MGGKKITKMADGGAQVVECLPSKCEALNSNPSTAKNFKKIPIIAPTSCL
jgi:hypothetical protein